jgi:small subunit ribosomal protein S21
MKTIKVTKNDNIDDCLKRLKELVFIEGTLDEVRRLRAFETPKERKIRKARRAARVSKFLKLQQMGRPIATDQF